MFIFTKQVRMRGQRVKVNATVIPKSYSPFVEMVLRMLILVYWDVSPLITFQHLTFLW